MRNTDYSVLRTMSQAATLGLLLAACYGCSDSSEGGAVSGTLGDTIAPDSGGYADTAILDAHPPETPTKATECGLREVRCRGLCFRQVGQQQDGCELIYLREESHRSITGVVFGEKTAFIFVQPLGQATRDILCMDLDSGKVKTVIEGTTGGFDKVRVYDGALYYVGFYEPWGDKGRYPIMKLSTDGTQKPASGMLAQWPSSAWNILDDYVYMVATDDEVWTDSIYRMPLGAGVDAPFNPDSEPRRAELVAQGVSAATMATDGTYLYYGSSGAGGGLSRVRIGYPDSAEVINDEWSYNFVSAFGLPEGDPDYIYFALVGLQRVPRAGGPSEDVIDIPGAVMWFGDTELLAWFDYFWSDEKRLHVVTFLEPEQKVLDDEGEDVISARGRPAGYYVASSKGIVRIDRTP